MSRVVAVRAHTVPDRQTLTLRPGDVVEVGERDTDWPAFVFVTTANGSGRVPERYLTEKEGHTIAVEGYDTTELATELGEELEVVRRDDESGWLWCRGSSGTEGWVPTKTVEPID